MRSFAAPALVVLLLGAGVGHADPSVDWATGLVIADGVGIADRHAPNPSVARGTSRRGAEAAARAELARSVMRVPVATGGIVGATAATGEARGRIDRAVAQAITIAAEPETDGAWRVTMGLPIEAIRQALDGGPRAVATEASDQDPAIVVVDGVHVAPAIGWTVGGAHAATLWVPAVPGWASTAPHVQATSSKAGAIEIGGQAGHAATLYVLVQTARSGD
jgi:hypothetical protein